MKKATVVPVHDPETCPSKHSFDCLLSEKIVNKRNGTQETGYGWPGPIRRWCIREKCRALQRGAKGCLDYIGIAADERSRIEASAELQRIQARYPLIDWGGLYKHFNRVSCFCCPLQRELELRKLYLYYPDLWKRLEEMDSKTQNTFKENRTIDSLRKQFEWEKRQLTLNF